VNGSTGRHVIWHKNEDGNLVAYREQTDRQGQGVLDRVRFTHCSKDRFEWRLGRSFDEGENWYEVGFFIVAERIELD
jgi:5-methylcytosine-specific restriction endonuclease McrBC regulatory subunit McrC